MDNTKLESCMEYAREVLNLSDLELFWMTNEEIKTVVFKDATAYLMEYLKS